MGLDRTMERFPATVPAPGRTSGMIEWHDLDDDGGPLGALELPRPTPRAPALELHLWAQADGSTLGAWLDEDGRLYRTVRSYQA
jgi:hypothetical protein